MARTAEQARAEFKKAGISIAGWARANGFNTQLVFDVLAGKRNPTRGQTHNIAVALGIKEGRISSGPTDVFNVSK